MPTSVLIVDDHPSFRASARLLLESEGWDVVGEAADGARALAAAAELKKHVTSIFSKLGLTPASEDHRRVLAVLAFLRS